LASCSGVDDVVSRPITASPSTTSFWVSAARNAVFTRCTTGAGVPPGAKKPNHSENTRSL
jgi:hypothetical protein